MTQLSPIDFAPVKSAARHSAEAGSAEVHRRPTLTFASRSPAVGRVDLTKGSNAVCCCPSWQQLDQQLMAGNVGGDRQLTGIVNPGDS